MRVKVFKSSSPGNLEVQIQEFLDTEPFLDDNQTLKIFNMKYSTAYSQSHDTVIYSVIIIYNGKGGKTGDN